MKDYLIAIEAKLLHPVNETFCSVPAYGANYFYLDCLTSGASAVQYKPCKLAKRVIW